MAHYERKINNMGRDYEHPWLDFTGHQSPPASQREESQNNGPRQYPPHTNRLSITPISDNNEIRAGEEDDLRYKENLVTKDVVEDWVVHTGKTILSNPSLFEAHIQEIDKELNDGPPTHEINKGGEGSEGGIMNIDRAEKVVWK